MQPCSTPVLGVSQKYLTVPQDKFLSPLTATAQPAMKTRLGPGLLLLIFLLPACLTAAGRETPYEKFQRQHVDTSGSWEPDPNRYCNLMMPRRNMTVSFCKDLNSFVHGALAMITAVCGSGGTWHHEDFYYSNSPFQVTDCQTTGASRWPRCIYRGDICSKRICVACKNGQPVHFAQPSVCGGP
ncbi:ribonuclease-like isoform X1 [Gopherus evgoodei]|uniref:ribonuclease-like isoform X1 n=2 Tax=Gopherus evgoodei TaxID=1825980 RepID=UPI0011CF5AE8|nr:ribonuclease-like isoform X1 [Gopherus evgoodei]